jgi:hypothetical protein
MAGRICVEFVREADRFRHEVAVYSGESWQTVWASVEGAPEEECPPSPPLQELHVEQRAGGVEVALLVGRAGRSHWSLSVEADVARGALVFDAACRSASPGNGLQSSYRLVAPVQSCDLQVLDGELRQSAADDVGLAILPRLDAGGQGTRTFRWRYKIVATP